MSKYKAKKGKFFFLSTSHKAKKSDRDEKFEFKLKNVFDSLVTWNTYEGGVPFVCTSVYERLMRMSFEK